MESMTVKTITRCNRLFSANTPNPLVSMIRLSDTTDISHVLRFRFFTVWLRAWNTPCPPLFGHKECDFSDGTLTFLQPGKTAAPEIWKPETGQSEGWLLCFHDSVYNPLKTGKSSGEYSFFRYAARESLHLSQREIAVLEREMDEIDEELHWGVDEYCHTILAGRIRLLLDYASRFYRRQFILRHDENQEMLERTDRELEIFFRTGKAQYERFPSPEDFAGLFGCSPDYFNDMLKHETGKDMEDYVKFKQISCAEYLLRSGTESVEAVAARLGFPTDRAFCTLFKKLKGKTPSDFISGAGVKHLN